jgi:biopolymer transport protein ExbB/TolQ
MKNTGLFRVVMAISMVITALLVIIILHFSLDKEGYWARLLLNRRVDAYPFTVQNIMWIVFFQGVGQLVVRGIVTSKESRELDMNYLSGDASGMMLDPKNLVPIYQKVSRGAAEGRFLPTLIQRVILMFQSTKSTDQAHSLLSTSLDFQMHEVDLGYNMLRYLMWLIPSLGFIGTVKGIGDALEKTGSSAANDPSLLINVTKALSVAYDGTFLALIMAALLLFAMHIIQGREEEILNRSGQYCLDRLINRLHPGNSAR